MAGCSKKQYAIMMSAGSEGKKLASEMGSMDQDKFNAAFEELLGKGNGGDYKKDDDEDLKAFDENKDDDFGFDDEPNPMDEFSGPDREGPSYAQMDFIDDKELKRYADRYEVDINDLKKEIIRRYQEDNLGMGDKDAIRAHQENVIDDLVMNNGKLPESTKKQDAQLEADKNFLGNPNDLDIGLDGDKYYISNHSEGKIGSVPFNSEEEAQKIIDEWKKQEEKPSVGKKKFHPVDSEGNVLDEDGIEADNEEEAFNIASKKFPGRGDELQVQEAEDDDDKKELSLENAIKSADDDVLDSQFGKDTPERKLAGAIKGASISSDYKEKGKSTWNQKLSKGDKVVIKDNEGNDLEGYIDGFWSNQKLQDEDIYEEGKDNLWHDFRGLHLVDKDGKHIGDINANQILKHERAGNKTAKEDFKLDSGTNEYIDSFAKKNSVNEEDYQKIKKSLTDAFTRILKEQKQGR